MRSQRALLIALVLAVPSPVVAQVCVGRGLPGEVALLADVWRLSAEEWAFGGAAAVNGRAAFQVRFLDGQETTRVSGEALYATGGSGSFTVCPGLGVTRYWGRVLGADFARTDLDLFGGVGAHYAIGPNSYLIPFGVLTGTLLRQVIEAAPETGAMFAATLGITASVSNIWVRATASRATGHAAFVLSFGIGYRLSLDGLTGSQRRWSLRHVQLNSPDPPILSRQVTRRRK